MCEASRSSSLQSYSVGCVTGVEALVGSHRLKLDSMPVFHALSSLGLENTTLDEASLVAISHQPNLKSLDLSGSGSLTLSSPAESRPGVRSPSAGFGSLQFPRIRDAPPEAGCGRLLPK